LRRVFFSRRRLAAGRLGIATVLRRLQRDIGGQALGEYAIIMALVAGLSRVEAFVRSYGDDPRAVWGAAGAFALVVVWLLRPKR